MSNHPIVRIKITALIVK